MKLNSCPKCATFWTFRWNLILSVVHKLWDLLNPVLGLKSICQTQVHLCLVNFTQLCQTLGDPMGYTVHGILQARILEWVTFPFSRVILPVQGSNPGLPYCRQILYQLSYKGSLIFLSNELLKVMIGLSLFFPNGSDITLEPFSIFL